MFQVGKNELCKGYDSQKLLISIYFTSTELYRIEPWKTKVSQRRQENVNVLNVSLVQRWIFPLEMGIRSEDELRSKAFCDSFTQFLMSKHSCSRCHRLRGYIVLKKLFTQGRKSFEDNPWPGDPSPIQMRITKVTQTVKKILNEEWLKTSIRYEQFQISSWLFCHDHGTLQWREECFYGYWTQNFSFSFIHSSFIFIHVNPNNTPSSGTKSFSSAKIFKAIEMTGIFMAVIF